MVRIEAYVPSNSPRLIGKTTSQWIVKGEGYSISEFKAGWKGPWGSRSEKSKIQLPDLRWPFSGILIVRPGQLKCLSVHPFEKNKVSPVGTDPVSQNLGTGKLVFGLDARYSTVVIQSARTVEELT